MASSVHVLTTISLSALAVAAATGRVTAQSARPAPIPFVPTSGDAKTPAPLDDEPRSTALELGRTMSTAGDVAAGAAAGESAAVELYPAPLAIDFSRMHFQTAADGKLWVRGKSYKACVDGDAATLVPFFGSRAPRNFELAFELTSVQVGGSDIALAPRADVRRDGASVTLDHGVVDEVYDFALEQVEQRFVIEALPEVGPLTVRVATKSELSGSVGPDGFAFSNDWGRVDYGRATAIDADGRRLELESELVDGEIAIHVPQSFVEQAALPLTIDPLITVFGVETGVSLAFSPDSSYDLSGGGVMHVYNVVFSLNDYDVYAYATDRFGNVWFGSGFWTDYSLLHWTRPRIAHNGATDRFLIAGTVGYSPGRAIYGHVRNVFGTVFTMPTMLSNSTDSGEKFNVDVGGDPYGALPSFFFVVYERALSATDHDIHGVLVDTNGLPTTANTTWVIDNSTGTLDALPSISKSNRADTWNIAWQRDVPGSPRSVRGARIQWAGGTVNGSFPMVNMSIPCGRPSVSSSISGQFKYLLACDLDFGSDRDVGLFLFDSTTQLQSMNLSGLDGSTYLRDQGDASVDSDGAHFLVAFDELDPVAFAYDVYASELQWNANGIEVRENRIPVGVAVAAEMDAQVVAAESSNDSQNTSDYTVVFNRGNGPGSGPSNDVHAALVSGSYGGTIINFCGKQYVTCPCAGGSGVGGCANSAFASGAHIAWSGYSRTMLDSLTLHVTGLKPNSTCLVFQGTGLINLGFGNPLDDGVRCVGGFITRFAAHLSNASGATQYPAAGESTISIQGGVPFAGGTYYYQTWYRDSAAFCASGTTNLSDAVQVVWTP